jgi:hypothetical protein
VIASWSPAAHAGSYTITVELSDGQRLALSASGAQRRIAAPAPARGLGARVSIQAIGPFGDAGRVRTVELAPAPGPGRVHGIGATRTRAGVVVRWRPVRGAVRYLVSIVVSGAGERAYVQVSALPRLRPSTELAGLRRGHVATITVRATSADAKLGPAGRALYKPPTTRSKR